MKDKRALAPWIKRFLLEYLPTDRNFARNTRSLAQHYLFSFTSQFTITLIGSSA
jgi:hypothetical protein